jgi:hypothetical protein
MSRNRVITLTASSALLGFIMAGPAAAQDSATTAQPPTFAMLTAMSAAEQTRLALLAAPAEVTSRASVYVLSGGRYARTRTGTNGFSCLVERELLETVEPVCYDAEGSATTLLARFRREELRGQGLREDEVRRRIDAAYRSGRLRAPRKPGIVYMLSPEQRSWNPGTKTIWTAPPHLMLYAPYAKQADLGGAPGPQIPFIVWPGQPDALMIVMAPGEHGH